MNNVNYYITLAIFLATAVGASIAALRRRKSLLSKSRMRRMMVSCGIDQRTARYADHLLKIDMNEARFRCRRCKDTGLCDRWLAGEAVAGNGFCPNMLKFTTAAARRTRATGDPSACA